VNHAANTVFDFSNTSNRRSFMLLGIGAVIGLAIAGYGLFTAAGTATHTVPPEYVALVNQRPIYRSDYLLQLQATYSVPASEASAEQKQKVLNDMINEELLVQRGLAADLPAYDPDVRSALVAGVELQLFASVLARQPSDAELLGYFNQHRDKYANQGMMQLRDLMVNTVSGENEAALAQRITAAVAALRTGKPVDAMMSQYQLRDSLRLQQGGKADLGDIFDFAAEANLPAPVFAAAMKLQPGMVSEPIKVEADGTHIVVMGRRQQAKPTDFEQVRSRVWTDIKNADRDKVRSSTLHYLHSKSEILTDAALSQ
jgi:PPIC-type PPIASE domain